MKHIARPLEFGFADSSFRLATESTEDGERLTREIEQRRKELAESVSRQIEAFVEPDIRIAPGLESARINSVQSHGGTDA